MRTREQRSLAGRIGAHASWSRTEDRPARTKPARDARMVKFEDQVDPERKLTDVQRRQMAYHAMKAEKAEMARLALISAAKARAARKAAS